MARRECAFCSSAAKLSAEHIWSEWINALVPGKKIFRHFDAEGNVAKSWVKKELDWTAKVVCEQCNNTWMSDIENDHAKPALADLITGKSNIVIDERRARSITLYCLKTSLVIDQISYSEPPFFRPEERYAFRSSLAIPAGVKMWMAKLAPMGKGRVNSWYGKANTSPIDMIRSYICTFAAGHFVFQLVAFRWSREFEPLPGFEHVATSFYPKSAKFVWPPTYELGDTRQFEMFAMRWRSISTAAEFRRGN